MTSPAFCEVIDVRNLMNFEDQGTSAYPDDLIQSNIYAASEFVEKAANRAFEAHDNVTLTFTTYGNTVVDLPGVRSVSSVTRDSSVLEANTTYWLLPDDQQSGVFTAMTFGPYAYNYRPPDWFDRGTDLPDFQRGLLPGGSLPNNLSIVANVGYLDADLPEIVRVVTKTLAGALTMYGPAVLTGALVTPDNSNLASTAWDLFQAFLREWKIGNIQAVSV